MVLWGAWVRISHSGNGCGETWPLCDGNVVPNLKNQKTFTEYLHRLTSGFFGIFVIFLFLKTRKLFSANHPIHFFSKTSVFFLVTEALLGAGLVILGFVGNDASPGRTIAMSLHFMNSLLLIGSLTSWCFFSYYEKWTRVPVSERLEWIPDNFEMVSKMGTLSVMFALGITGTIAALSNTLFPSAGLIDGIRADLNPMSHFIVKWRALHPIAGLVLGSLFSALFWSFSFSLPSHERNLKFWTKLVSILLICVVLVGGSTLVLLSPTVLKFGHLLLVYLLWISLVIWINSLCYKQTAPHS